jgi:hypothetical protein
VALSHGGQLDIRRAEPGLAVVLVLPINADETAGADRLLRR